MKYLLLMALFILGTWALQSCEDKPQSLYTIEVTTIAMKKDTIQVVAPSDAKFRIMFSESSGYFLGYASGWQFVRGQVVDFEILNKTEAL